MDMSGIVNKMRQEFAKELDSVLAQEARQHQLKEEELEELAAILPEVVIPQLSASDEKKALKIKDDLDKKVDRLAELTEEIGQVAGDYKKQVGELHGLLMGKKHDINAGHTRGKLSFMLKNLSRILENNIANAVIGFCTMPDKSYIHRKINTYTGI